MDSNVSHFMSINLFHLKKITKAFSEAFQKSENVMKQRAMIKIVTVESNKILIAK